jgi:two-component system osmolarity sensor histidine kinase EnvZ
MDAIIGDFITYVRSGNIEEFQQVSLTEIINETIEQFSQMKKSIQYKGNNKPLFIKIKPLSFKRMLSNILDNAFKYGEPPIEITVKEANQFIVLNIRDHGHGVSQQALKTLFEPFVMANNTENQYGSGLGLSIVKKLAQQNNIVVQAKNHSDGGLVISLQLHQ